MQVEWSEHQIDCLFDALLIRDNHLDYQRVLRSVSQKFFGPQPGDEIYNVDQLVRRRAHRRTEYTDPKDRLRISRLGKPWTWAERRILRWCLQEKSSESGAKVDFPYMARILQRSVEEIEEEVRRSRTEKHGIKGFEL